ncbi:hypothetical protein CAN33_008710 [Aspergillus niger]|uniref:Extracellular mutant protein 11 C-terminal domain-containing protein n=1 Tax=Aspergillus niger TaxID=5061 RepID=A0A505IB69_ASPNG|nr:hypothetical protein CAN33_008710 [Aspergillus niger]
MGVGDYVHSKEAGQPRPRTTEVSNQSRQAVAAQARIDVPPTNLVAPVPLPINKSIPLEHYSTPAFSEQMPQAPAENGVHRDMFDTDVEGIDESTIAATSVMGAEDAPLQFQLRPATVPQYQEAAPVVDERPLHPSRLPRRAYDGKWYENFGDKAMKSAGFDSEDADDASQLTSMAGDDERSDTTEDANYARRYRSSTEEPLSKRLQSFWNVDDDNDPINDPFARRNSVQRIVSDPDFQPNKSTITSSSSQNKRRNLESDYPPEILRQKSFKDLQSEPFDHTPTATASAPVKTTTPAPTPGPNATSDEKMDFLMNSEDKDRRDFFSTLTMNEWEDYGDLLIDQFSDALSKMKDLRHARRKTAALFEAEIARRNEVVEEQSADLTRKLEEMRSGGAEVLKGRTP